MQSFRYKAYDKSGKLTQGSLEAGDEQAALALLVQKGLQPFALDQGASSAPWWAREITFGGESSLSPATLERFFRIMATLLSAQFPLMRALEFCRTQSPDKHLTPVLEKLVHQVEAGAPLARAVHACEGAFPERYMTMIATGEVANRLPNLSLPKTKGAVRFSKHFFIQPFGLCLL